MDSGKIVLLFTEGLLSFVSPCILPLLPVYFVYLAGGIGQNDNSAKSRLFTNSLGFVIGFSLIFVALGATATALGNFLGGHLQAFKKLSGVLVILFGINFAGFWNIPFLNREKRFELKSGHMRFAGAILFGIIFGFAWTPCVSAFLGTAFLLAANSKTVFKGSLMLFVYSMGLGIPFILSALLFDRLGKVFVFLKKHSGLISKISGILLIGIGIMMLLGIY